MTVQGLFRSTGIMSSADLAVSQSVAPAMSVSVALGWGVILGTYQVNMGAYQFTNDAATTLTISAANATNPRIDLICVTVTDAFYSGAGNSVAFNVVAGVPAGSPVVPATPVNSIVLAQIAVAALTTSIVTANITDVRTKALSTIGMGASAIAANTSAVANNSYYVNTVAGAFTITFPLTANLDDEIRVYDAANNAGTNNITINFNGLKFQGVAGNLLAMNTSRSRAFLKYSGSTDGWEVF